MATQGIGAMIFNSTYAANRYNDSNNTNVSLTTVDPRDLIYAELSVKLWIDMYIPPIIILPGLIGNLLLFLILRNPAVSESSTFLYMKVFAAANIPVLLLGAGVEWLCEVTQLTFISLISDAACRLWMFIYSVIIYSATWYIVLMCIDRYIFIWHGRKAIDFCTVFVSKIIVIVTLIGLTALSIHAMWTYELHKDPQRTYCIIPNINNLFQNVIWPWISSCFYTFIPLTLIFCFHILILVGTCAGRIADHESLDGSSISKRESVCCVLALSLQTFLLSAPMTVYHVVEAYIPREQLRDRSYVAKLQLINSLLQMIVMLNHALGPFTTVAVSPTLRQLVTELFTSKCHYRKRWHKVSTEMNEVGVEKEDEIRIQNIIETTHL